jgi:hypothetical protein
MFVLSQDGEKFDRAVRVDPEYDEVLKAIPRSSDSVKT